MTHAVVVPAGLAVAGEHRIEPAEGDVGPPMCCCHATRSSSSTASPLQCGRLDGVTILIDEARWWHPGHALVPPGERRVDDELHEFAGANGIPRACFQGDHYDIPEEYRADLIAAGAEVVDSRELLRRLRGRRACALTPATERRHRLTNAAARREDRVGT